MWLTSLCKPLDSHIPAKLRSRFASLRLFEGFPHWAIKHPKKHFSSSPILAQALSVLSFKASAQSQGNELSSNFSLKASL